MSYIAASLNDDVRRTVAIRLMARVILANIYAPREEKMKLLSQCHIDADYCLDAPEDMPAGACAFMQEFPDTPIDGWPEQQVWRRA